jgi:single-strand DNA-binding protein
MAQGDIPVTVIGNLTNDPELRFTPSGQAVASFTVASSTRLRDPQTNEWKDGDTTFLRCSVWRQYAENVAESLTRGTRVIVNGRLKQRSYETKEGEKRTVYEVDVDDVGPALRYATAKITKVNRGGGGGFGGGGFEGGAPSEDPWASSGGPAPAAGGAPAGGSSWGGSAAAGAAPSYDEPPF